MSIRKRDRTRENGTAYIRWVVEYTDQHGKIRQKACASEGEAKVFEQKAIREVKDHAHVAGRDGKKFKIIAEKWLRRLELLGRRRTTTDDYKSLLDKYIYPTFAGRHLHTITGPEVSNYFDDLIDHSGLSFKRIRRIKQVLGAVVTYGIEKGVVARNVVRDIKLMTPTAAYVEDANDQHIADIPTIAELKQILECDGLTLQIKVLIHLATYAGTRPSETFGAAWKHLDLKNGLFKVRRTVDIFRAIGPTKTPKSNRDVPLPPDLVTLLKRYYLESGKPDPEAMVFPNQVGKFISRFNWGRRKWTPYMAKLKLGYYAGQDKDRKFIPRYHYKDLRHAYASLLIKSGANAKEIMELMGHTKIATTYDFYGHLFTDDTSARDAINRAAKELLS